MATATLIRPVIYTPPPSGVDLKLDLDEALVLRALLGISKAGGSLLALLEMERPKMYEGAKAALRQSKLPSPDVRVYEALHRALGDRA